MVDEFATVGGSRALLHFAEKPLVVVHHALYRLLHKGAGVAAAVGGKAGQLSLQVGIKIYFHAPKGKGNASLCQARLWRVPARLN